jgi:hypothetical protein
MANPIAATLNADTTQAVARKRYETGRCVSVAGGIAEIDVGAVLPNGTAQNLFLPVATGTTLVVGQAVSILYPNDNPNAAYVVAADDLAQTDPTIFYEVKVAVQSNSSTTAYTTDTPFRTYILFMPRYSNSAACTIDVGGIGAKHLCAVGGAQLSAAGAITAHTLYWLEYDQSLDTANGGFVVYPATPIPAPVYTPFAIGLSAYLNGSHDDGGNPEKVAERINASGLDLTVLGVSCSQTNNAGTSTKVDVKIDGTSMLTGVIGPAVLYTAYAGTISGTPVIHNGDKIELWVKCNANTSVDATIWVQPS